MANAKLGSDDRTTGTHGPSGRANGRRAYWRCAIQCALSLSVLAGWPRWAADDGEGGVTSVGMGTALAAPAPLEDRFRIGVSYYGALALDWDTVVADEFCALVNRDFSVVRVWATWCGPDCDSGSLVNKNGNMKTTQQARFKKMLQFAKAKGMIIDLAFEPAQFTEIAGNNPPYDNYRNAIKNVATWVNNQGFQDNVIIDVCNECAIATDKNPDDYTLANTALDLFSYTTKPTDYAIPLRDLIELVRGKNMQGFFSVVAAYDTISRSQDREAVGRGRQYYEHVYNRGLNGAPLAPHFGRKPCDKWDDWTDDRIFDLYDGTALDNYPLYLQEENRRGWAGACCGAGSYQPSDPYRKDPCMAKCTSDNDIGEYDFYAAANLARSNPTKKAWCWVFHTDAGFACRGNSFFDASRLDAVELGVVCNIRTQVVIEKLPGDCFPTNRRCRLD